MAAVLVLLVLDVTGVLNADWFLDAYLWSVFAIGAASRRLEQALGDDAGSPFAAAMQSAMPAVDELAAEVERTYKGPLA